MSYTYSGMGLKTFTDKLKAGLEDRVDKFYDYVLGKYKNDPHAISVRTNEEWTDMFKEWCKEEDRNREIKYLAEQYVLGNTPNEEKDR